MQRFGKIIRLDARLIAYFHVIEAKAPEMGSTDKLHENEENNSWFDNANEKSR